MKEKKYLLFALSLISLGFMISCDKNSDTTKAAVKTETESSQTATDTATSTVTQTATATSTQTSKPTITTTVPNTPTGYGMATSYYDVSTRYRDSGYIEKMVYAYSQNNKEYTLITYYGTSSEVTIPSEYDDGTNGLHPVTSICANAFNQNLAIRRVNIPSTITEIGDYAFFNCYNLDSVYLGKNIVSLGKSAFGLTEFTAFYIEAATIPTTWNSDWNDYQQTIRKEEDRIYFNVKREDIKRIHGVDYFIQNEKAVITQFNCNDCIYLSPTIMVEDKEYPVEGCLINHLPTANFDIPYEFTMFALKDFDLSFISCLSNGQKIINVNSYNDIILVSDGIYYLVNNQAVFVRLLKNTTYYAIPSTITVDSNTYQVTDVMENAFRGCSELGQIVLSEGIKSINLTKIKRSSMFLTKIDLPLSLESITDSLYYDIKNITFTYSGNSNDWEKVVKSEAFAFNLSTTYLKNELKFSSKK